MAKEKVEDVEKFPKESLIASLRFSENKDLLNALLEDGQEYTLEEAEEKIKGYLKKEVK